MGLASLNTWMAVAPSGRSADGELTSVGVTYWPRFRSIRGTAVAAVRVARPRVESMVFILAEATGWCIDMARGAPMLGCF